MKRTRVKSERKKKREKNDDGTGDLEQKKGKKMTLTILWEAPNLANKEGEKEREIREWKKRKKIIRIKFEEREPYDSSKYDCLYYTSCITWSRTPIVRVNFLSEEKSKKTLDCIYIHPPTGNMKER